MRRSHGPRSPSPQLRIHQITQVPQLALRETCRVELAERRPVRIRIVEFPQRPGYNLAGVGVGDFDPLIMGLRSASLRLYRRTLLDGFCFGVGSVANIWEHEFPDGLWGVHPCGPLGGEQFVPVFVEVYFGHFQRHGEGSKGSRS